MNLTVVPQELVDAAGNLERIGSSLSGAQQAAKLATTQILPAGAEEVSAAITALFNDYGAAFQELTRQATALQQEFAGLMISAHSSYLDTESTSKNMFETDVTNIEDTTGLTRAIEAFTGLSTAGPLDPPVTVTNSNILLVMGGTGGPNPPNVFAQYIAYDLNLNIPSYGLSTPEQGFPLTPQLGHLSFNQSFAQGQSILNSTIHQMLAQNNNVTYYGVSQSATIISHELYSLQAQGYPGVGHISFVLQGDPSNPNGGLLERMGGLYVPGLDVTGGQPTPTDSPYPISIWTNQYDPFADFPQYPLNFISDANAVCGILFGGTHAYFPYVPPQDYVQTGQVGNTTFYYHLDTGPLPITIPIRDVVSDIAGPTWGQAVGDFIQPDLRVFSDLGYGSPYVHSPQEASLLQFPNWPVVGHDLVIGTIQGFDAAGVDLGLLPYSDSPNAYPYVPTVDPNLNLPYNPGNTGLGTIFTAEGWIADQLEL